MKTDVKKQDKNKILVTIEVPPADVTKMLDKAAGELAKRVRIPGFRQGRVPRSVLEAKVGEGAIASHAMETEVPVLYKNAVTEIEYEPIATPELKVVEVMTEGKKFVFEATVEVKPEVGLIGYKGLKVDKPSSTVTAKDVTDELDKIRQRFADLKDSKTKTVKKGHFVVIDFEGTMKGVAFEGGTSTDHMIEIGSGTFWKGFEDQLVGFKKGEEKTIKVDAPKDYFVKDIAGKKVDFKVNLKEIKEKILPEIDDAFAKKVGFKDLAALKKDVKDNLAKRKELQATMAVQTQALDQTIKKAKVEVPKAMIDDYGEKLFSDFGESLNQRGVNIEDYLKMTNQSMEDIKAAMLSQADDMAKRDMVLEALAKKEGLAVSDKELEKEMETLLGNLGEASKQFTEGEEAANRRALLTVSLKKEMTKKKALDFLVEHSVAKPKAGSKEDKKK